MSDDPDAELFNAVIESRLARMSDADWHALTKRVRPPADPAPAAVDESQLPLARRSSFARKCGQLADLAEAAGGQGQQGGFAAALNARGVPTMPELPQPQPEPVQQGFQINRAQGASASDPPPINTKDVNKQRISDILNGR